MPYGSSAVGDLEAPEIFTYLFGVKFLIGATERAPDWCVQPRPIYQPHASKVVVKWQQITSVKMRRMSRSWRLFEEVSAETHEQNSSVAVVVEACQSPDRRSYRGLPSWSAQQNRCLSRPRPLLYLHRDRGWQQHESFKMLPSGNRGTTFEDPGSWQATA